jgi:hypothetical protein
VAPTAAPDDPVHVSALPFDAPLVHAVGHDGDVPDGFIEHTDDWVARW